MSQQELQRIVSELRGLPAETTWCEFKQNSASPEDVGEYISALSNAAALEGVSAGYLVWGIENQTHNLVGTTFEPATKKGAGDEDLLPWLSRLLDPAPHLQFQVGTIDSKTVVLLEVPAAEHRPTQWKGEEFIRVGSSRKKLKNHP